MVALRARIEATIELLIDLLDDLDGDPDLEPPLGSPEPRPHGYVFVPGGDPLMAARGSIDQRLWSQGPGDGREEDDDREADYGEMVIDYGLDQRVIPCGYPCRPGLAD